MVICSCGTEKHVLSFADTLRIEHDLRVITQTNGFRNYRNVEGLNSVAEYIFNEFSKTCDTAYYQSFFVNEVEYRNVIGILGKNKTDRIVIGAHYDVAGEQQGADDNASGITGILELSRLFSIDKPDHQIEFVAYSLEEPPFFRTDYMGSHIHARSLFENETEIMGMICLDMIGYFNENKNSQYYPIGLLKLFYGNKGDFITVVQKFGNGKFGRQIKRKMKKCNLIKTKSFRAPSKVPGIDFSDHLNYWRYNYNAVMITNSAFYRNPNYHKSSDTLATLDVQRMGLVIDEIFLTIKELK